MATRYTNNHNTQTKSSPETGEKFFDSGLGSLDTAADEGCVDCSSETYDDASSNYTVQPEERMDTALIPKHGLDSCSSKQSLSSTASDQGYHSNLSTSSSSSSYSSTDSFPGPKTEPSGTSGHPHKFRNFLEFFQYLVNVKKDPYTWTSKDFSGVLSKSEVERAGQVLWDVTEGDEDGDFETINAARDRDEPAVAFALFLAEDAKVLNKTNLDRQTVLHVAAEMLDAKLVRLFMAKGADGAIADLWGNTPLHLAARFGRPDVVQQLTTKIKKEELGHPRYRVPYRSLPQDNKDQMNNDGKAPVHLAAQGRHSDTLRMLAAARVNLDQRRLGDGYTALHIAVDNGDFSSMKTLLECGADVEVKNHRGETPQQLAYLCQRQDMVHNIWQDMVGLCNDFGASPNQLLFAETEAVDFSSESDMEVSDDDDLSSHVSQMSV